jgi:hypothetical protein
MAYRLLLRRDAIRWLRERRAQLYVEMLAEAYAERYCVTFATYSDSARELMRESFAETDTRLPPLDAARLGANGSAFASHEVRGLYELLFAEAWPVEVYPERFRSDEARLKVLARTARILGDLEAAVRRELGADQIPPMTRG